MKKVLSILLLFIFLFNVGGYYILFWGLRFQTDRQLNHRLDVDHYDREQAVELKIPVTLPYPVGSNDYERINGRFEYKGEFFKLIKQKLQGDTLYVICLRDEATRELVETMTDYVQLTQALPGDDNGQQALIYLTKLIKDFCPRTAFDIAGLVGSAISFDFADLPHNLAGSAIPVQAPPPKA